MKRLAHGPHLLLHKKVSIPRLQCDCKHADGMFVIVDCKTLLELLPSNSSDAASTRRTLVSLTPRVEAAQKQETAEMLGKLKGIGNSLLGKS